jgi:PAS domain S-box-containing protein
MAASEPSVSRGGDSRYRFLVERVRDYAIFSTDTEGKPTTWNEGVERVLGFREEEFVGRNVIPLIFTPEDVGQGVPEEELATARRTGSASDDRWMRRSDGTRFWGTGITTALRSKTGTLVGYVKVLGDSTRAKRTEDALRRLEFIVERAGWAVAATDAGTDRLEWVNPAFARMHGYSVEELMGMPLADLMASESRAKLPHAAPGCEDWVYEAYHHRKDGTIFPVLTHASALKDETGRTLLRSATFTDISDRKETEEALRTSEERYRMLFNSIDEGFCVVEMIFDESGAPVDYRFLEVNHAFEKQSGLRDATGKRMRELAPGHEAHWFEIYGAVARTGQSVRFENRAEALRRWFDVYAFRIGPANSSNVGVLFVDITDRKRVDRALQERERQLAEELASMTTLHEIATRLVGPGEFKALLQDIVDAAVAITHAQKGNIQLYDRETKSLRILAHRGLSQSWLQFFEAVDETRPAACSIAMVEGKRVVVENVATNPIFAGSRALEVQLAEGVRAVQSTPILSRSGEFIGMLSTHFSEPHRPSERELQHVDVLARQAADYLEHRRANSELRLHAEEMEKRVDERTATLNESFKALETLLYTIAHDLRAPNRAMQGYAELLTEDHAEKLNEEGRFLLNRISRAALRNEQLIRDLLEFGRLAHSDLPCQWLNPGVTIAAVLASLEEEIRRTQASIKVADDWPSVWANDSALGHVITNLVSNSLKYVLAGIRPVIGILPRMVSSGGAAGGASGRVRICVEDNGIGIAEEQKERVFEPFQRASPSGYEGTGMGLAIVRKAAERMGGSAGVHSDVGKGSCFWVELRGGSPELASEP